MNYYSGIRRNARLINWASLFLLLFAFNYKTQFRYSACLKYKRISAYNDPYEHVIETTIAVVAQPNQEYFDS